MAKGFEEVKDLIRGTITADISNVRLAYEHFAKHKLVRIVEIKSLKKIEELQNITVIFEFDERFIGEM